MIAKGIPGPEVTAIRGRRQAENRPLDIRPFHGDFDRTGHQRLDTYGGYLRGEFGFDGWQLRSTTAFDGYERDVKTDTDFTPNVLFETAQENDAWQVFQELEAEGELEYTSRMTQAQIAKAVDLNTACKAYNMTLDRLGPYRISYTADGRRLLLGGRKGPPRGHSAPRGLNAQTRYGFDALFAQADASRALAACKDGAWSNSNPATRPTDHKFHYQVLSHVLYGTSAEEPRLAQVLDDRTVHPVYNLVSCQFAMHHFAQPKSGLWGNLRQLLASDGLFVATVPNGDFTTAKLAATGQYVVPIRDVKTGKRVPWYRYESAEAREGHVHFETPKINRNEEPLLTEEALRAAVTKARLDVVMVEPFGAFVDACGLSCYTHGCWAFDKETFDPTTLTHVPDRTTPTIQETAEALEYSREGHWVVVLCQRGRTEGERTKLRQALLAAGGAAA